MGDNQPAYEELVQKIQDLEERIFELQNKELSAAREKAAENEKAKESIMNKLNEAQMIAKIGSFEWNFASEAVWWSRELYRIFEVDPAVYIPSVNSNAEFVHPEDTERFHQTAFKSVETGDPVDTELRIISQSGKIKFCRFLSNIYFDENRNPVKMVGTLSDITHQIEVRNELIKAKEKAEESDRLKTAFLQNMSHEIRTPMNAICGFSELLESSVLNEDKRKKYSSIIQNSSQQLLAIVTNILTISSLETKQERVSVEKVNINTVIADTITIFKKQADSRNISLLTKQRLDDIEAEVYTDRTKINQIISNLLGNALKFTHTGFIEFGYMLKDNMIEFSVKDSGIGIRKELHEKIFDRFRQADQSIQLKYGGTGLGLSISKGLVELLGGKIWLVSEPDQGSVFYFTIPYKPVHKLSARKGKDNVVNTVTILAAEDEVFNFQYIEEVLQNYNINLIHARNGKEAVDICRDNSEIDLILMDIKMPEMNGHSAAEEIKRFRPNLPIIAQSAYALEEDLDRYSKIFDSYLIKPLNRTEMITKIKKYIHIEN